MKKHIGYGTALVVVGLLYAFVIPSPDLFVFVGEKIDVREVELKLVKGHYLMDNAYQAKYRVLERVYGSYSADTINFLAFDHYGFPAFAETKFVLLYVSKENGKLYHEKYQYSPLFKTKEGRWAGPYAQVDYEHPFVKNSKVKPEAIDFGADAFFELARQDTAYTNQWFPATYYKIEQGKAVPVAGNYVPELFELKKQGVLKARGLF